MTRTVVIVVRAALLTRRLHHDRDRQRPKAGDDSSKS